MYIRALKQPISKLSVLCVAVSCLSGAPLPAMGQQLEEVLVKATRRVESMQDVPLAVSAMSAEDLTKSGVFETSDLNRIAPNLQVSSPYGEQQPNFSIRGVGVGTEFNVNAASPVGVYVDEVYQTFRSSHGQQLFDMEQVEIVRGPQGTLFGRNTTGGAINFITRKPELEGLNGYVSVGAGNYGRRSIEGAFEVTPTDNFGVRLAGTYVEVDPYIDNVLPAGPSTAAAFGLSGLNVNSGKDMGGNENYGVRAVFRYQPNEDADFLLKVYKAKAEAGTYGSVPIGGTKGSDVIDYTNPEFGLSALWGPFSSLGLLPATYSQSANGLGLRDVEQDGIGDAVTESEGIVFTANYNINERMTFIAVTGIDSGEYHQDPTTDCDATPLSLCAIGYNSDLDAFNVDLRLDYSDGPLKFIVGAFYGEDNLESNNKPNFFNSLRDVNTAVLLDETGNLAVSQSLAANYFNPAGFFSIPGLLGPTALPTGITGENNFEQDRESWAIYSEMNYALTESLNLTVGLRYSDDTLEYSNGITTFYDDAGNPRLITVSDFNVGGQPAPYFLDDLRDIAGNLVAPASILNGGAPLPGPLELDAGSDSVSGRIIIDWNVAEDAMLYASFSRGYRAGTVNGFAYGSAGQVYFVPDEEVDAFEVGFKSQWIDNRLQVNGSFFTYDYTGQQGQVVDASATAFVVALDGEIQGAEVESKFALTDALTVSASFGWLDSEYDDGPCPAALVGFQEGNCIGSPKGPANVGGNPFPYAAEFTFNGAVDWDIASFAGGDLELHADASYTDDFYYDAFGDYSQAPLNRVAQGEYTEGGGDFWVFNARLSYISENYSIAVWGKNLADEDYFPFGINLETLFGNGYKVLAPPRTYGIELKYMF